MSIAAPASKRLLVVLVDPALDFMAAAQWGRDVVDRSTLGGETAFWNAVLVGGFDEISSYVIDRAVQQDIKVITARPDGARYEGDRRVADWHVQPSSQDHDRYLVECAKKAEAAGWTAACLVLTHERSATPPAAQLFIDAGLPVIDRTYWPDVMPVVWVDTETGGRAPATSPLIEVGAIETDRSSRRIVRHLELKIAIPAGMWVEREAAVINGYTEAGWRDAVPLQAAMQQLADWLPRKFQIAGYNVSFDTRFLEANFDRCGIPLPGWIQQTIDPMHRVKSTLKRSGQIRSGSLDCVCEHFQIHNATQHRALADAERARLVYLSLLGHKPERSIFDQELP